MVHANKVLFDYITQGDPGCIKHTKHYLSRYPQFRQEIVELAAMWRALSTIESLLPPEEGQRADRHAVFLDHQASW